MPWSFPSKIIDGRVGPLFVTTDDITVANTVTESSIVGTGEGTLTIPANSVAVGNRFSFSAQGRLSSAGNPTLRLQIKLNAVALGDIGAATIGNNADNHWILEGEAVVRSLGVTGTMAFAGVFVTESGDHFGFVNTVPVVIDTTISQTADITATWGTPLAGNTITSQIAFLDETSAP